MELSNMPDVAAVEDSGQAATGMSEDISMADDRKTSDSRLSYPVPACDWTPDAREGLL